MQCLPVLGKWLWQCRCARCHLQLLDVVHRAHQEGRLVQLLLVRNQLPQVIEPAQGLQKSIPTVVRRMYTQPPRRFSQPCPPRTTCSCSSSSWAVYNASSRSGVLRPQLPCVDIACWTETSHGCRQQELSRAHPSLILSRRRCSVCTWLRGARPPPPPPPLLLPEGRGLRLLANPPPPEPLTPWPLRLRTNVTTQPANLLAPWVNWVAVPTCAAQ